MKIVKLAVLAGFLAVTAPVIAADQATEKQPTAEEQALADEVTNMVETHVTGEQIVTVNTGNETVDAVANLAVKCGERSAAFKACDSMGGFKAMTCKKIAEVRYKNVECPNL